MPQSDTQKRKKALEAEIALTVAAFERAEKARAASSYTFYIEDAEYQVRVHLHQASNLDRKLGGPGFASYTQLREYLESTNE